MSLNSGTSPNAVRIALNNVFDLEFNVDSFVGYADATDKDVFKQETAESAAVITEQFMGAGHFEETAEEEDNAQGSPKIGNQKTTPILTWTKEVKIPKRYFDDDMHSTVKKMIRNMAKNGRITRDRNAFDVFKNGFTTQTTNDGAALFSNNHTTLNGDTVDNLLTGALSESSLDTAFTMLMEQQSQDGVLGGHMPATLLVPTALSKTAYEITKSEVKTGVNNDEMNYYSSIFPGLVVKTNPHLGAAYGGSDTAWFLLSADHGVVRYMRQGVHTNMVDYSFSSNQTYRYSADFREAVDSITYEGLVGSTGVG